MYQYIPLVIMGVLAVACLCGALLTAVLARAGKLLPREASISLILYGLLAGINIALFFNQLTLIRLLAEVQNGQ